MTSLFSREYEHKAAFFDKQVDAPWAANEYTQKELGKLERLRGELKSTQGKSILEPGCGTGRLTEILSDWVGLTGKVTALDVSAKMVEQAEHRLAKRKNVVVLRSALEDLPIKASSYDVVLHHQVFPHYNDQARALKTTFQALKPGGSVIVFHFIDMAEINNTHRKAGTAVEKDLMPEDQEMLQLFSAVGLNIKFILNDENGYFLSAIRPK